MYVNERTVRPGRRKKTLQMPNARIHTLILGMCRCRETRRKLQPKAVVTRGTSKSGCNELAKSPWALRIYRQLAKIWHKVHAAVIQLLFPPPTRILTTFAAVCGICGTTPSVVGHDVTTYLNNIYLSLLLMLAKCKMLVVRILPTILGMRRPPECVPSAILRMLTIHKLCTLHTMFRMRSPI